MRVGLLGLQGAFLDHIPHLERCGVEHIIVRDAQELADVDRLIIPGGESTVMAKFLEEYDMLGPLVHRVAQGMPVWGVCAGAILLAERVDNHPGPLSLLPIAVTRNAYGRQIDSVTKTIGIPALKAKDYPAIFIRAPKIDQVGPGVMIHARRDGDPIFVQKKRVMATTFHPELNRGDDRFHHFFLSI